MKPGDIAGQCLFSEAAGLLKLEYRELFLETERVENYRRYHLSAPPRGHEWRLMDGNYVLVNTGNFQIRTVVVAH